MDSAPNALGFIHVCKVDQEQGLAYFSPLVDGAVTLSLEQATGDTTGGSICQQSALWSEKALFYSCPRLWYAVVNAGIDNRFYHLRGRRPSVNEVEHFVWTVLGSGAKGLLYRGTADDFSESQIARVNMEVVGLLPQLRYAIPVECRMIERGRVRLAVLQAGFEEMIVILTNNTMNCFPNSVSPGTVELLRDVRVQIPIPSACDIQNASANVEKTKGGSYDLIVRRMRHVYVERIRLMSSTSNRLY